MIGGGELELGCPLVDALKALPDTGHGDAGTAGRRLIQAMCGRVIQRQSTQSLLFSTETSTAMSHSLVSIIILNLTLFGNPFNGIPSFSTSTE